MKKYTLFLVLGSFLFFSSCIDIIEEIHLNKNGSGRYTLKMDMSGLMADGGMRSMLEELMQSEGEGKEGEALSLNMAMEMDTVIYFKDAHDSIRNRLSHPELLDRISIHQLSSEEKKTMVMSFILDFNKVEEINFFLEDLDKLQGSNPMQNSLGGGGLLPSAGGKDQLLYKYKRCTLERLPVKKQANEQMNKEDMAMAKMMFGDAVYKTIYHFPGKVKKASHPNARIDGKSVILEVPMADVLEGEADFANIIKFKKR